MMHAAAHRGAKCADVMLVTPAEFRRMERDRAAVARVLDLADVLDGLGVADDVAAMIRAAVAGPA